MTAEGGNENVGAAGEDSHEQEEEKKSAAEQDAQDGSATAEDQPTQFAKRLSLGT